MEKNSELEFASLKSPVIALRAMPPSFSKRVFRTKPPLKKEVARSAGGFLGDKLQFKVFISQKSPVIALRAMPPSFSKRVFLTSFEKGGGAKRRRIFGRQTPIQSLSPKNHPSSPLLALPPSFPTRVF